jgi:hypothetical protein
VVFVTGGWQGPEAAQSARRRRRIYCEMMPIEEVAGARVLDLLRGFDLELVMAVRPGEGPALARLLERANSAGVRVAIWPMVADREGRWASAENAARFCAFAEDLVVTLGARGLTPAEVLVDLEPPFTEVREILDSPGQIAVGRESEASAVPKGPPGRALGALHLLRRSLRSIEPAARIFARFAEAQRARGIAISSAVVPLVLLDPEPRDRSSGALADPSALYQALLGTPADGRLWGAVSAMLYTSMIAGFSRGLLRRADVLALLAMGARAARSRWGERAGVSLGVVGTGALGDEPVYRDPSELVEDVLATLSAGIRHLSLFDLSGVLRRPPAERWLSAFTADPPPAETPATPRAAFAASSAWLLGRGLGALTASIRARGS